MTPSARDYWVGLAYWIPDDVPGKSGQALLVVFINVNDLMNAEAGVFHSVISSTSLAYTPTVNQHPEYLMLPGFEKGLRGGLQPGVRSTGLIKDAQFCDF